MIPVNQKQYILGFGMTLRARGFMTDNILEGYRDPYNRDGDAYGFTYNTPRAQARRTSFVASSDGHYNSVPDFSNFMNHVYTTQTISIEAVGE